MGFLEYYDHIKERDAAYYQYQQGVLRSGNPVLNKTTWTNQYTELLTRLDKQTPANRLYRQLMTQVENGNIKPIESILLKNLSEEESYLVKLNQAGERITSDNMHLWADDLTLELLEGNLAKAKSLLREKIIQTRKGLADKQYIMASAKALQADFEEANAHYEKAVQLEPGNNRYRLKLSEIRALLAKARRLPALSASRPPPDTNTDDRSEKSLDEDRNTLKMLFSALVKTVIKQVSKLLFYFFVFITTVLLSPLVICFFKQKFYIPDRTFSHYAQLARDAGKPVQSKTVWKEKYIKTKTLFTRCADATPLCCRAADLFKCGDLDAAEQTLGQCVSENPKPSGKRQYLLGSMNELKSDFKRASQYYEQATHLEPDNSQYLNSAGWIYNALGNPETAASCFEKALAIDLRTYGQNNMIVVTDYNNLASVFYDWGKYQEAITYYEKALDIAVELFGYEHSYARLIRDSLAKCKQL